MPYGRRRGGMPPQRRSRTNREFTPRTGTNQPVSKTGRPGPCSGIKNPNARAQCEQSQRTQRNPRKPALPTGQERPNPREGGLRQNGPRGPRSRMRPPQRRGRTGLR